MAVTRKDSVTKIVDYFAAITKVPFTYKNRTAEPTLLKIYPSIASGYTCPPDCGACCEKFTLDYIEGEETPDGVEERDVKFNGNQIKIMTDKQADNGTAFCKHVRLEDARCKIHGTHPFSCDFELIRVYKPNISNHYSIRVAEYGRGDRYRRFNNDGIGTLCEVTPPTEESAAESIRKLKRLKQWSDYFKLTETWLPEIIEYMESGKWENGPLYLGGPVELFSKTTKRPAKEKQLLFDLIAEGRYTRREIMQKLLEANPEAPKDTYSSWLTGAKHPKHNPFKWRVVVGEDDIWRFE